MRNFRNAQRLFILILTFCLLVACNPFRKNSIFPGVNYIAPLGHPPADNIFWSRDSNKILVNARDLGFGNAQIYILEIETKEKTLIVDTNYGEIWGRALSPDGRYFAFSVAEGTKGFSQGGLWVINRENYSMENYSTRTGDVVWLPGGNTIAFLTGDLSANKDPRTFSISLINVETKESELIYSGDSAIAVLGFSSSPDGRFLVFSLMSDYANANDLYILDVQARTMKPLTHNGNSAFPQWSPQGDLIVYQKTVSIGNKILKSLHIILADGSCDVEVPNVDYVFSPTWSPDGRKIAFIGEDGIYILDTDIVFGRDIYQNLCP